MEPPSSSPSHPIEHQHQESLGYRRPSIGNGSIAGTNGGSSGRSTSRSVLSREKANSYAQKLNNSAVLCIEIGEHERAIKSLGKALKLLERSSSCSSGSGGPSYAGDPCCDCTLDGCLSYSETIVDAIVLEREMKENGGTGRSDYVANGPNTKKRRLSPPRSSVPCAPQEQEQDASNNRYFWTPPEEEDGRLKSSPGSIYRRPIRIPPRYILEGSIEESTLVSVINFNIALAFQLWSIALGTASVTVACNTTTSAAASTRKEETKRQRQARFSDIAIRLYTLADPSKHGRSEETGICPCTSEEEPPSREGDVCPQQSPRPSSNRHSSKNCGNHIRFHMIVCNNLSQLYRSINNVPKHKECLQDLLSSIVLLVDQYQRQVQEQHFESSNSYGDQGEAAAALHLDLLQQDYCEDEEDVSILATTTSFARRRRASIGCQYHLHEFAHNTAHIVLRQYCADAA